MEPLRISTVQFEPFVGDDAANAEQMISWMQCSHDKGAKLVCFPEACLTGYSAPRAREISITPDSTSEMAIRNAACTLGIAVSYGFIETGDTAPTVTHVVFDGTKAKRAIDAPALVYRKTHLGRSERNAFCAGDALSVGCAAGSVIGVQLCWEAHIPDIATTLRLQGAELLLVPFASPLGGMRRQTTWERFLPARAYDNGVFVIAANALSRDVDGSIRGGGLAAYGPDGAVLASSYGQDPAMILCDLDGRLPRSSQSEGVRGASYFDERRPELYRA